MLSPVSRSSDTCIWWCVSSQISFFYNNSLLTHIYTLSLHDALPIFAAVQDDADAFESCALPAEHRTRRDRKSTRLNSSHRCISYAVFCLKKKKKHTSQNSDS